MTAEREQNRQNGKWVPEKEKEGTGKGRIRAAGGTVANYGMGARFPTFFACVCRAPVRARATERKTGEIERHRGRGRRRGRALLCAATLSGFVAIPKKTQGGSLSLGVLHKEFYVGASGGGGGGAHACLRPPNNNSNNDKNNKNKRRRRRSLCTYTLFLKHTATFFHLC